MERAFLWILARAAFIYHSHGPMEVLSGLLLNPGDNMRCVLSVCCHFGGGIFLFKWHWKSAEMELLTKALSILLPPLRNIVDLGEGGESCRYYLWIFRWCFCFQRLVGEKLWWQWRNSEQEYVLYAFMFKTCIYSRFKLWKKEGALYIHFQGHLRTRKCKI